jgi:hypothetical protein
MGASRGWRRCCVVFCGVGMVVAVFFYHFLALCALTPTEEREAQMSHLFVQNLDFHVLVVHVVSSSHVFFFLYLHVHTHWGGSPVDGPGRNVFIARFETALCCLGSPFLVSSSHSSNTIRLPFRCFWTRMAMVGMLCPDSHMHLRRSLCHESGWSLATAAAMPHGDYLNRMAHTHVCCVHVCTCTHTRVCTHMWTATLCASRLLLLHSAGASNPRVLHRRSSYSHSTMQCYTGTELKWDRSNV